MPDRSRQGTRAGSAHFSLWSRGRIYGIFSSLEAVQLCTTRLMEQGLGDQAVQIIMGEEGQRALDVDGQHHGMWGRFLRLMQGMTDERPHVERYVQALGRGEIVLSVDVSGQPQAVAQIAQAFRDSQARFVNHYGAWVVEPLGA